MGTQRVTSIETKIERLKVVFHKTTFKVKLVLNALNAVNPSLSLVMGFFGQITFPGSLVITRFTEQLLVRRKYYKYQAELKLFNLELS